MRVIPTGKCGLLWVSRMEAMLMDHFSRIMVVIENSQVS